MNQPLARNAGNALEAMEAIEFLSGGKRQPRLEEVVLSLGAEMLILGGLAKKPKAARIELKRVLDSGKAAENFSKMVSMQGGPGDLLERPQKYFVPAPVIRDFPAPKDGCVEHLDTRAIGLSIVGLGGGRLRADDKIDHRVGLSDFRLVGQSINKGDSLVTIHAASEEAWQTAAKKLQSAILVGRKKDELPAVYEWFS